MITAEQIPDEVAFALLDRYALWRGDTDQARAAIAAALAAWPGVEFKMNGVMRTFYILPLPQETRHE